MFTGFGDLQSLYELCPSCAQQSMGVRAWCYVCVCFFLIIFDYEDVCALYLNVIVQMLFDIARTSCVLSLWPFFFVASFHVCQCEFGFPLDSNLCLVGIGSVLC